MGAVVAADTEDIATEALRLIVVQWEELPFILDQEEALGRRRRFCGPEPKATSWQMTASL